MIKLGEKCLVMFFSFMVIGIESVGVNSSICSKGLVLVD